MAKRVKETAPESGLVKVVDPMYDAPMAVEVTPEPPPMPSGPTVRQRILRFFDVFLRLVSWVIIFTVFGAALYFGLPWLYQRFVVPVEQNTVQMAELQSQQQQLQEQVGALQSELDTLKNAQSESAQSLTDLEERTGQLETNIASHTESLAALEQMQTELQAQDQAASAELQRQIELLKSLELLSRARLYLYQSNFGLARQDVQLARDLLAGMRPAATEALAVDLDAVLLRLDLVLGNLPTFPVAANDDLDIAWQILVSGLPDASLNVNETSLPGPTPSATVEVTPTSGPEETPQPTPTQQ